MSKLLEHKQTVVNVNTNYSLWLFVSDLYFYHEDDADDADGGEYVSREILDNF